VARGQRPLACDHVLSRKLERKTALFRRKVRKDDRVAAGQRVRMIGAVRLVGR
jgi:hypothetical protein